MALFVALGGGAYAAAVLPANSVGANQIKKSAVERSKLKKNAVDGTKVLDNALTGDDIKESSLLRVPWSADSDNALEASHAATTAGLDKITYKVAVATAPAGTLSTAATAFCDAGQRVVGGGVRVDNPATAIVDDSYPDGGGTAWTAHIGAEFATSFTVIAICVPAAAVG